MGVLALRQIPVRRVGRAVMTMIVEGCLERRPSESAEQHHIANNDCLWEGMRHHHLGSLWGADSRYQIDSAFEGGKGGLQISLPIMTFVRKRKKTNLSDPQMVKVVEMETACL